MPKASDIFPGVRALLFDPNGDYASDDVLVPYLHMAQQSIQLACFNNPNIGRLKSVVVLQNVPAGTTSLRAAGYFDSGGQLALLQDVLTMREKKAGDNDINYLAMEEKEDVPVLAQYQWNSMYVFTGNDIMLPGATQNLDIRIFGAFGPAPITSPDSDVFPGIEILLKFGTAALAAGENLELSSKYITAAEQHLNIYLNNVVMEQQLIPTRPKPFGLGETGFYDW